MSSAAICWAAGTITSMWNSCSGLPTNGNPKGGSILFVFFLGPERDSFFQMDPELLLIELSHGKVVYIAIVQG